RPRPICRIAVGRGKLRAQSGSPFSFVSREKVTGIKRPECVAADSLAVLEDQAQFRFERQIRPDKNPAESFGIILIECLAVVSKIAGLQAHVICTRLVPWPGIAYHALVHPVRVCRPLALW